MDRRKFVTLLSSSVVAGKAASALGAERTPQPRTSSGPLNVEALHGRPNVIFFICDDLGYGDLGCYGSKLPTPNIDRLKAEGTHFTRMNAGHPICSASRAAVLTGRYGTRSGTTGAFGPHSKQGTALDETLLSNLFHDKGYKTKAVGKWHLGELPQYLPTSRGFDSFYGVPYSVDMNPLPLMRDLEVLEKNTDRRLLTPRYTAEALRYIDEIGDKPYFMYLAYSYPHDPARASERFSGKTQFGDAGDAIAEIDWSVGEVLRAVERKGQTSNTLVCFTSDHGPWYQGCPGALRGRKASTFEGGFRVPFIARWPGRIAAGASVDDWCSNLDFLPTLAAICGLDHPAKPLDGINISSSLTGGGHLPERKPILYFSPMGNDGNDVHCIRKGDWKLRVAQATGGRGWGLDGKNASGGEIYINDRTTAARNSAWLARPELYNLARDPAESYNVAKLEPGIVAELTASLEVQMPSFPAKVKAAYNSLRQRVGDISTPPAAAPRPPNQKNPAWSWEPLDRRPHDEG